MKLIDSLNDSLPSYMCTLPYSKIKTKFRPFLVKEEKKLLILEETSTQREIYNGIIEVLTACFETNVDFSKIPLFEVEWCFLKLRAKSVGETINPKIKCPITKENHPVEVDINNIDLIIQTNENIIKINKNLILGLKYPTINELIDKTDDINQLIANCITYVEDDKERVEGSEFKSEEILDFLDHLTIAQYQKILVFFEKMPSVSLDVNYKTTDGVIRSLKLKGLKDFFT